jgi:hypothetical protein
MNVSRFLEVIELLLDLEKSTRMQKVLVNVQGQLESLVSEPNQPEAQQEFVKAMTELDRSEELLAAGLEPAQRKLVEEIGGYQFYIDSYAGPIRREISANPLSPSVVGDKLKGWIDARNNYVSRLQPLRDTLKEMQIEPVSLQPGEAEIGFLVPRELFNNRLTDMI